MTKSTTKSIFHGGALEMISNAYIAELNDDEKNLIIEDNQLILLDLHDIIKKLWDFYMIRLENQFGKGIANKMRENKGLHIDKIELELKEIIIKKLEKN